jgi:hypothetical protein
MAIQVTAALFRLLIALPICLIAFRAIDTLNRPHAQINTLSTILSNQTLTLSLPSHSDTGIPTAYIPTSLTDHGQAAMFWCGLLALASAGAYVIDKLKHHIWTQLYALDEGAKAVPKGEKLRFHLQGVRNLDLTGWVNKTEPRDTFMAWAFSLSAIAGVLYGTIVAGVQNFASDTVTVQLERFLNSDAAVQDVVFGSLNTHGSYTLESWTCQIAPLLLSDPEDTTKSAKVEAVLRQACRDGRNSRYMLLVILPFAILMLLAIAKPHWLTFTLGAKEKPAWMTVPLQDNESDGEDDDPMAGFGGNARDQWQLDSD